LTPLMFQVAIFIAVVLPSSAYPFIERQADGKGRVAI
jgi:hypothetical protein